MKNDPWISKLVLLLFSSFKPRGNSLYQKYKITGISHLGDIQVLRECTGEVGSNELRTPQNKRPCILVTEEFEQN